jgi:hypothetical protein
MRLEQVNDFTRLNELTQAVRTQENWEKFWKLNNQQQMMIRDMLMNNYQNNGEQRGNSPLFLCDSSGREFQPFHSLFDHSNNPRLSQLPLSGVQGTNVTTIPIEQNETEQLRPNG